MIRRNKQNWFAEVGKLAKQLVKKPAGAFVDTKDPLEIEQEVAQRVQRLEQIVHHCFGSRKGKIFLELIDLDPRAELAQRLSLRRCADSPGIQVRPSRLKAQGDLADAGPVQQVQIQ